MADTATLNPFSTKPKETRVNLNQMVGGTFETLAGSILGTPSYETGESVRTPVPEYVREAFSSGSMRGFNESHPKPVKNEAQLIEAQRAYLRNYNIVAEATKVVENYEAKEVENQVRLEMAGMSDEERAIEGNYQAGYRGPTLKTIYNTMWIFFKKVATRLAGKKEQITASIAETRNKGKSAIQGVFEGASGQIGKGQGNISFQATG